MGTRRTNRAAAAARCAAATVVAAAAIGVGATALTAGAVTTIPVDGHGSLEVALPAGWKHTVRRPPRAGLPPTIEFEPADGRPDAKGFTLLVTVIPSRGDPAFNSPERLKRTAETQGRGMLASAKETELKLEEVKGEKATAYLFTVTDKAPDPGSFEYATAGSAGVGDLLLAVTFLHHEKDSADRRAALQMLKTARQGAAPAGGAAAAGGPGVAGAAVVGDTLRIGPPGAAWELVLPAGGLTVKADQSDPAGRRRQVMAVDEATGLTVSVFVEPAAKAGGDAKAVRDLYWGRAKQSPLPKSDVKLAEAGELATVDYLVAEVNGLQLNQRNLNVYAAHAGYWVDLHVSKVRFDEAADRPLFDKLAKGVKFEAKAAGGGGGKPATKP